MTARVRDWQSRLQACLAERWGRPFAWGSQDCALFAADCVQACTGVDPAAELRGTYRTAAGALEVIALHGGLAELAAARLGEEIAPSRAQPGDIGLLINGERECLGVCTGAFWHAPGADGLVALPGDQALQAWRLERPGD